MRTAIWIAGTLLLGGSAAHAAGFEKAVGWSGRYAGMGGPQASAVEGPVALAFNPAGLAAPEGAWEGTDGEPPRFELSLNFSPTMSRFSGPISTPTVLESNLGFSPVFGALASAHLGRVGLGVGAFYVGGTNVTYPDVDFSSLNPQFGQLKPDFSSYLALVDVSVGAGVELVEGLRVGAAWRVSLLSGELTSAAPVTLPGAAPGSAPIGIAALRLDELSDAQFTGFRVGAQFAPAGGRFGVGVNWRTPVTYTADGKVSGQLASVLTGGVPSDLEGGDAKVAARLPGQVAAGFFVSPMKDLRVLGEYVYTRYSDTRRLAITGTLTTPLGAQPVPSIPLEFLDQHNIRGGLEYLGLENVALRAGYVWTSRVTQPQFARATLSSPGPGNSITAGAGTRLLDGRLGLDASAEFSFASGEGTNELRVPGEFKTWAAVLHLAASYAF